MELSKDNPHIVRREVDQHLVETRVCPTCGLTVSTTISICPNDATVLIGNKDLQIHFSGSYELIGAIGSGGMGTVYKARHVALDAVVAIKMLTTSQMDERGIKRFQQEAALLSKLDHIAIVHVRDFGVTTHGQPYMVLDFIDGQTLAQTIKTGPLDIKTFCEVFVDIADAMSYAHKMGVLHRDLKPGNIMLSKEANVTRVKILDFGIAKALDADYEKGLTKTGEVFGSPAYMSPEQAAGIKVDQRSDIYSLGCIMYEALTGKPPFAGETAIDVLFKQMNEPAPALVLHDKNEKKYAQALSQIVSKALSKDPAQRHQSMSELGEELLLLQSQKKKPAPRSTLKLQGKQQEVLLWSALAICTLLLVMLTILALAGNNTANIEKPAKEDIHFAPVMTFNSDSIKNSIRKQLQQKIIRLDDVQCTDDVMRVFGEEKAPIAEELHLRGAEIQGDVLAYLIRYPLKVLKLNESKVNNSCLVSIGRMEHLENLQMDNTAISNADLQQLKSEKLNNLSLINDHIDDEGLRYISKLRGLRHLHIGLNPNITAKGLSEVADLPVLASLYFKRDLPDLPPRLFERFKMLNQLNIIATPITDSDLKNLGRLKNLEHFDIEGSENLTGPGLAALAQQPVLNWLVLKSCKRLKDDDMKVFLNFKSLRRLELQKDNITDAALPILLQSKITELDLSDTKITDRGLQLLKTAHHLTKLNLVDCRLSKEAVSQLRTSLGAKCDLEWAP